MYICLCNPFTDKDVKKALSEAPRGKKSPAKLYKSCSGGQKPCCGSCMCMLKDIAAAHEADELLAAE